MQLAEALFRVVRRDGIHAASVRTVAAEAGTAPSALRHYFATQDELLAFALRAVVDRAAARVHAAAAGGAAATPARERAAAVLEQLLPLDGDRREEMEVYLAFATRAQTDPGLRRLRDDAEAATRSVVHLAVGLLGDAAGSDPERVADRTYHLVDGLALHAALWPQRYPAEHQRAVLAAHLADLAGPDLDSTDLLRPGRSPAAGA